MERLVEWNCKEKNSALPLAINEDGDTVPMEDICAQLATIYDILGDDYDLDRLRELVKADREGRCKIIPEFNGKKCGSCKHFKRISGTMRGTCKVRPLVVSRWGGKQLKFEPNQSHLACSRYESALKGEQA